MLASMAAFPISSKDVACRDEAADEQHDKGRRHEREARLDELADRFAEEEEQRRHEIEAHRARHDARCHERQERHVERAGGNREDLERKRGPALGDEDPDTPVVEQALGFLELGAVAIEPEDRFADVLEDEVADGVARDAADDRCDGRQRRVPPRLVPVREDHGDQHDVGRDRKERAFGERDGGQRARRILVRRRADHPVVGLLQHRCGGSCGAGGEARRGPL